jgi:hypothetical protein
LLYRVEVTAEHLQNPSRLYIADSNLRPLPEDPSGILRENAVPTQEATADVAHVRRSHGL